jgi:hypothetical protein
VRRLRVVGRRDRRRERDRLKKEKARKAEEDAAARKAAEVEAAKLEAASTAAANASSAQPAEPVVLDAPLDEATLMAQLGFAGFGTTKVRVSFGAFASSSRSHARGMCAGPTRGSKRRPCGIRRFACWTQARLQTVHESSCGIFACGQAGTCLLKIKVWTPAKRFCPCLKPQPARCLGTCLNPSKVMALVRLQQRGQRRNRRNGQVKVGYPLLCLREVIHV